MILHSGRNFESKTFWRYLYTLFLIAVGGLVLPITANAQLKKPNILVIFGDDIGYSNISAYSLGMTGYKTPNIDRLAKEGPRLPISMGSSAARRVAQRSSSGNILSAGVC